MAVVKIAALENEEKLRSRALRSTTFSQVLLKAGLFVPDRRVFLFN